MISSGSKVHSIEFDAAGERVLALHQLEAAAETAVAMVFADGQHMRVQVDVAGARAGYGEREADHNVAFESPHHLASNFVGDHEHAQRNQFRVAEIPDFFLQGDAARKSSMP